MASQSRNRKKPDQTRVVTTGSTVRIEQPKSKRGRKPTVSVIVSSELNPVNGFVNFLREHAVVGLAVGFAIGSQAQLLVKQLADSFISPLLAVIIPGGIQEKAFSVHSKNHVPVYFKWGLFMYAFINFLFVLAFIYVIIKISKLDKLDKPKT